MRIKLYTPKSLKAICSKPMLQDFLLSLVATTISIILTFGTAYFIDRNKKENDKLEIAKMLIYDMDMTIRTVEENDSVLSYLSRLSQEIAQHPESFDSLKYDFLAVGSLTWDRFPETTERIFSTSIETINTIGNANFVSEVSSFYISRKEYKRQISESLDEAIRKNRGMKDSLQVILDMDFPFYAILNAGFLVDMIKCRNRSMRLLGISKEDMKAFAKRQKIPASDEDLAADSLFNIKEETYLEITRIIQEAKENLQEE